jgi:tRNA threonylcarbamoyladenosine biosynthesis protein TsaB
VDAFKKMKVIGIETSGNAGSIAVCEDDTVVKEHCFEKSLRYGTELTTSIKAIFDELHWKPDDIDLIAVSAGPGSYTGLRVGITCAKTLAYALNKPIIAVPTLDVLAENAPVNSHSVCPILDARRMCVYACVYTRVVSRESRVESQDSPPILSYPSQGVEREGWERASDFLFIPPEQLLALLPRPVTIYGDGTKPYLEIFNQEGILIGKEEMGIARASVVARLGRKLYEKGERCNVASLTPLYLRKPAPIEKLESKS